VAPTMDVVENFFYVLSIVFKWLALLCVILEGSQVQV
jgi:hypothetical protein